MASKDSSVWLHGRSLWLLDPAVQMLWVSANTSLTFLCIVTARSPARLGSVLPSEASLQRPQTVQKAWVSCPKPSLAHLMGAQALTEDFKELGVLCETAGMPIPVGSCSQSLQKETSGFLRQTCSGSQHPGDGGKERLPPSWPLVFEPRPLSFTREQQRIHQAKMTLSTPTQIPTQPNPQSPVMTLCPCLPVLTGGLRLFVIIEQ